MSPKSEPSDDKDRNRRKKEIAMPKKKKSTVSFDDLYRQTIAGLTRIIRKKAEPPMNPTQQKLVEKNQGMLDNTLDRLKEKKPTPASVFRKGLAALSEIDKERFLIENLLEAVKNNRSLRDTLEKYRELGLTDIDLSHLPLEYAGLSSVTDLPTSSMGAGKLLQEMLNLLKMVAIKISQLVIFAMKASSRFAAIKPSIGLTGAFPTFSLQFDLEIKPATLKDLFEDFVPIWK